jgi:AcrR family transcriptional regulator
LPPADPGVASRAVRRGRTPRRTQEERSAETRARVIAAASECVVERGFRGATMTAIADRAGVTWGAMQHQFGDKDAILDAVMEEALLVFERDLSEVGRSAADAGQRVRRFVARAEELLRGRSYRAYLEIQLNRSRSGMPHDGEAWARHVAGVLDRSWEAAFGDLGLPRRALEESKRFGFMALAGMATERMLFPEVDRIRLQLASLRDVLLRIFGAQGQ